MASLAIGFGAVVLSACADDGGDDAPADAGRGDRAVAPGDDDDDDDDDDANVGPIDSASVCAATRAYYENCGGDLECGPDHFDAWCRAQDPIINSDAFRRAQLTCLTSANCNGDRRRACTYETYRTATPTAAQRALVDAFCATCEADAVDACRTRHVTYDPDDGPSSVSDVFIAAWELADGLVDQIRASCTGSALTGYGDAGADGGPGITCLRAFSLCAGDLYIDAFPACPE